MREEIEFPGFQDLAQIGMRQGDRSGFRLVIHQRHKRRVFAVRKSHPAFNPILDPRGQFCGSGGGKNHKTCIRGRPCSQVKGLRLSQHGKVGLLYTPFLFIHAFFRNGSTIRRKTLRRRIWAELSLAAIVWSRLFTAMVRWDAWRYFLWLYLAPAFLAANMQSLRKYIEHVGLTGSTVNR